MKPIIFLISIIISTLFLDFSKNDSLKYMIREVNIDTSNFKTSNFEIDDLSFLLEITNLSDKDTVLRNFNKIEFKAAVLKGKKTEYFKLDNSYDEIMPIAVKEFCKE